MSLCLQVQEALLRVHWGPDILALHPCRAEMSGDALVWQGEWSCPAATDRAYRSAALRPDVGSITQMGMRNSRTQAVAEAAEQAFALPQDPDVRASNSIKMVSDTRAHVCCAGPRIKMGLYSGIPIKVVPHTTTGRADYFGTLVRIQFLAGWWPEDVQFCQAECLTCSQPAKQPSEQPQLKTGRALC